MLRRQQINKPRRYGQGLVEYIIMVAAVVGLLLVFLGPSGMFRKHLYEAFYCGTNGTEAMADAMFE